MKLFIPGHMFWVYLCFLLYFFFQCLGGSCWFYGVVVQAPALIFQAEMPLIDALPQSGLCIYFRTRSSSPLRLSDRPWTKEVQKRTCVSTYTCQFIISIDLLFYVCKLYCLHMLSISGAITGWFMSLDGFVWYWLIIIK